MIRSVLAVVVMTMTAGCGSTSDEQPPADSTPPTQPTPIHSPLVETDSGRRYAAPAGAAFRVRLTGSTKWGPLTASAGSVEEVYFRTDPGYREWQVTVPETGEVVLASTCHGCADLRRFRVTVVVG